MKDTKVHQIIQKFKNNLKVEHLYLDEKILTHINMSTKYVIPNSLLFKPTENDNTIDSNAIDNEKETSNEAKFSGYEKTNEVFYGDGILGNLYGLHHVSYNWLLGICMFKNIMPFFNENITSFCMGVGKCHFIKGAMHYMNYINYYVKKKYNMEWMGMDKRIGPVIVKKYPNNLISGFNSNDMMFLNNIQHSKTCIENKFGKVNLLCNFILPRHGKEKILLGVAILSVSVLHNGGCLITRLEHPRKWNETMINYILLFSMLFNNVEICKYPVQIDKFMKYRYYLVCHKKKETIYSHQIYRRLMSLHKETAVLLSSNYGDIIFTDPIVQELKELSNKLCEFKVSYNSQPNSIYDSLMNIIIQLKDVCKFKN